MNITVLLRMSQGPPCPAGNRCLHILLEVPAKELPDRPRLETQHAHRYVTARHYETSEPRVLRCRVALLHDSRAIAAMV